MPEYHFAYDKIKTEQWDDQGEVYDLKSAMHYDGNGFLTQVNLFLVNS